MAVLSRTRLGAKQALKKEPEGREVAWSVIGSFNAGGNGIAKPLRSTATRPKWGKKTRDLLVRT
jgi:hypothetical protein